MSKEKTDDKERRKHKRYRARSGTCALNSRVGEIIDISRGGLAFRYVDRGDWKDMPPSDLGILFGNGELCLEDVPLKVISDCAINDGINITRRCGVQFKELTEKQLEQLEYFIWANTIDFNEADEEFSA